jgi:hypothetical protein
MRFLQIGGCVHQQVVAGTRKPGRIIANALGSDLRIINCAEHPIGLAEWVMQFFREVQIV